MADFPGAVGSAMQDLPVEDEPGAESGSERQENQVTHLASAAPRAEMILRQRARVAIVLNEHRQPGETLAQAILQAHPMPAGKIRRVYQDPLADAQRPTDRHAQGHYPPAGGRGRCDQAPQLSNDRRQGLLEWAGCNRRHLHALQDMTGSIALDAGDLGSADIETEDGSLAI